MRSVRLTGGIRVRWDKNRACKRDQVGWLTEVGWKWQIYECASNVGVKTVFTHTELIMADKIKSLCSIPMRQSEWKWRKFWNEEASLVDNFAEGTRFKCSCRGLISNGGRPAQICNPRKEMAKLYDEEDSWRSWDKAVWNVYRWGKINIIWIRNEIKLEFYAFW